MYAVSDKNHFAVNVQCHLRHLIDESLPELAQ